MTRKWYNIIVNWSIEFGPIFLFFCMLAYLGESRTGFVYATGIFTLATILALAVAYIREGHIAPFAAVAGIFIAGFGIATVYFDKPEIFMFKDTAYNGFFALFLLPGLLKRRGDLKYFFNSLFDLKERGWLIISFQYFVLFVVIAVANEIIWRNFSQSAWIINKYIASFATIALGFAEIPIGKKYRNPTASSWGVRVTSKSDKPEHFIAQ